MSVITMNNLSSLRVKLDAGLSDSTGKTIVKSKTYSNLKHDANNQDVYDVAQALMELQDYDVLEIIVIELKKVRKYSLQCSHNS